jgi:hypothetical protein
MMQSQSEILTENLNAVIMPVANVKEEVMLQIEQMKLSAVKLRIPNRRIRVSSKGRTRHQNSATKLL